MIEQQYYTRERGGLFSQGDGYDTVAKTPLLKPEYIKKNIHPLCNYDLPAELVKRGEIDESKYPPNFLIFPTPTGEMIVGQAIFKSKDFTGLRSTFFMHNFVLSGKEKRRFVKEPEKLFGITGFATSYNLRDGQELPTLAGIPYDGDLPYFQDRNVLFSKLGMSEETFHQLIYATFAAAHSKKKIFIVLNVPIEELGQCSKALLYHLYLELPWSITETLGVCTYSGKLEAKKSIQIIFIDQYTMRYDTRICKEFIFDFVNNKFLNMEENIEAEPYIKVASRYSRNKVAWEKFNRWADALSVSLKENEKCDIDYYGKIAVLLDMSACLKSGRSYDITNSKVRKGLMRRLYNELTSQGILEDIRAELSEVLEYTIALVHRRIAIGELLSDDELKVLLDFKLKINEGNLEQEAHCIQMLLALLEVAARENKISYMNGLFEQVRRYLTTYVHLYQAIYERNQLREKIVYPMIDEHLRGITLLEELMSVMSELEIIEPILLMDDYYKQKIFAAFHTCLHVAENHLQFLLQVQNWTSAHKTEIYSQLREECEGYFVKYASLEEVGSEEMLCNIHFTHSYYEENYEVIRDYQSLRTDLSFMSPKKIRVNPKVQELIKLYYKQKIRKDDFYMLVYAFLEPGKEQDGFKVDLKGVLNYLNAISTEMMLEFIIWSKGQEVYLDKNTFDYQVVSFFSTLKQKEGKIPKEKIKAKLVAHKKTKKLGQKILNAQKTVLQKWLGKHRIGLILGGTLILGGISGGMGAYWHAKNMDEKKIKEIFNNQTVSPEIIEKLMPQITLDKPEVEQYIKENKNDAKKEP